jgi:hypothetical protein
MPKVTWTGDASSAERAANALAAAQEKVNKKFAEGAKGAKSLEQAAAAIVKANEGPQERYNRRLAEANAAYKAGKISVDDLTKATARYRQELQGAGDQGNKAFGPSAIANVRSYFTGLATVGTAISLIKSEFAEIVRLDERAANRIRGAAVSDADLRRVIATDPNRQSVLDAVERVAREKNLPVDDVRRAATAAYGATSDANLTALALDEAFAKTRDPLVGAQTAQGIGFILQSSTIRDPKEAGGFIDQVLAFSPIVDEKAPQQLGKVLAAFTSPTAGGSEGTAAAVLSLLAQAANDPEGERSRTGAITLEGKLDTFFEKNRKKFQLAKEASDGIDEQLGFLFGEGGEAASRQFIESTKFEAPVAGGFAKLFLDPEYRAKFRAAVPVLGSREARLRAAVDTENFVGGGALQGSALTNDIIGSSAETLDLSRAGAGILTPEKREELILVLAQALGGSIKGTRGNVLAATGTSVDRSEALGLIGAALGEFEGEGGAEIPGGTQGAAVRELQRMRKSLSRIEATQNSKGAVRKE